MKVPWGTTQAGLEDDSARLFDKGVEQLGHCRDCITSEDRSKRHCLNAKMVSLLYVVRMGTGRRQKRCISELTSDSDNYIEAVRHPEQLKMHRPRGPRAAPADPGRLCRETWSTGRILMDAYKGPSRKRRGNEEIGSTKLVPDRLLDQKCRLDTNRLDMSDFCDKV